MDRRDMIKFTSLGAITSIISPSLYSKDLFRDQLLPNIEPFQINFEKERIDDLLKRLERTEWPNVPFRTGWDAGTNDEVLRDLVNYWRHDYDWYKVQDQLNKLNHFHITIDNERVHFVHYQGSAERQNFPLLLIHGWPSSFLEFTYAAKLLAGEQNGQAGFDLIIPSLPGYVFSDAPRNPGMHVGKVADRLHQLMIALGYDKYGISAGDAGAFIAYRQAHKYPESIYGFHFVFAPTGELPNSLSADEQRFIDRQKEFNAQELGYYHLQATKPQTLSYALQDSPVGTLGYILEKYWGWTDHGADLWKDLNKDDVLTTTMFYWMTGSILSSFRLYYETRLMVSENSVMGPIPVPTGYSRFPKEPWSPPKSLMHPDWKAKLIYYNEMSKGGHFPALEEPALWACEVRNFFLKLDK